MRCLGAWIDNKLSWKYYISRVSDMFWALSKLRRYRKVLSTALKTKHFQPFVLPNADYCAVAWQECTKELQTKLEWTLNYGMRLILSQDT